MELGWPRPILLYSLDFEERWHKLGETEQKEKGKKMGEDELGQDLALECDMGGGVATAILASSWAKKLKGNVIPRPMNTSIVVLETA